MEGNGYDGLMPTGRILDVEYRFVGVGTYEGWSWRFWGRFRGGELTWGVNFFGELVTLWFCDGRQVSFHALMLTGLKKRFRSPGLNTCSLLPGE